MTHPSPDPDPVALARSRMDSKESYARFQLFNAEHLCRYIARFVTLEDRTVVDLGCGSGGIAVYLSSLGNRVVGLDNENFGPGMLTGAKRFALSQGQVPRFVNGDLEVLPLGDARFDLAVLNSVIEHTEHPEKVMSELRRILVPGGMAFIDFPLYYSPRGHHLGDHIEIPWLPILFPSRVPGWLRRRCADPASAESLATVFRTLNRMTISRFKDLVRTSGFEMVDFRKNWFFTHEGTKLLASIKRAVLAGRPGDIGRALVTASHEFTLKSFCLFLFFVVIFPLQWLPFFEELTCPGIRVMIRRPS